MIVDTSALVAILFAEVQAARLFELINASDHVSMSAASVVEFAIVSQRRGTPAQVEFAARIRARLNIEIDPVTARQADLATAAYRAFGKGSGHPAGLNFGDCFAYALAIDKNEPLLFVGDDFAHTDVRAAR